VSGGCREGRTHAGKVQHPGRQCCYLPHINGLCWAAGRPRRRGRKAWVREKGGGGAAPLQRHRGKRVTALLSGRPEQREVGGRLGLCGGAAATSIPAHTASCWERVEGRGGLRAPASHPRRLTARHPFICRGEGGGPKQRLQMDGCLLLARGCGEEDAGGLDSRLQAPDTDDGGLLGELLRALLGRKLHTQQPELHAKGVYR